MILPKLINWKNQNLSQGSLKIEADTETVNVQWWYEFNKNSCLHTQNHTVSPHHLFQEEYFEVSYLCEESYESVDSTRPSQADMRSFSPEKNFKDCETKDCETSLKTPSRIETNHDVWWEMKLFILWYINTEASQVSNGGANMNHPKTWQCTKKKFPPLSIETTNGKNTHHKPVPLEENHHLPILGIILPQHTLLQHIPGWFNKHIKHL